MGKDGSKSEDRKRKLHGSAAKRGMAKWGGQLQRLGEKPKGKGGPGKGRLRSRNYPAMIKTR